MDNIYESIVTQKWQKPKQLVASQDILILYGITPGGYIISCPLVWYRKIILLPTTVEMEISLSSTSHSGQHLKWPMLVFFTMILGTS